MIWLLGENKGKEASNNVFYFWKNAIKRRDEGYDAFYVAEQNTSNELVYNELQEWEKEFFIWKNSKQHLKLYEKSYLNIIQNDLEDIVPSKIYKVSTFENRKRIIVLDDGIYHVENQKYMKAEKFNGLLTKIYTYNILDLSNNPDVKEYQLTNNRFLYPRLEFLNKIKESNNNILWYLTGKSYTNEINDEYRQHLVKLISDHELAEYLINSNRKLNIVLGREFEFDFKVLQKYEPIMQIQYEEECNFTNLIAESGELITDYSPIVWDFALAGKKVHIYTPDLHLQQDYTKQLINELKIQPSTNVVDLLNELENGLSVHENFTNLLSVEDTKEITKGKSSNFIIDDLLEMINKRNTFVMYNFYGVSELNKYVIGLGNEILKNNGLFDVITVVGENRSNNVQIGIKVSNATDYKKNMIVKYQKIIKTQYKKGAKLVSSLKYEPDPLGVYTPELETNLCEMIAEISSGNIISTKEVYHHLVHDYASDLVQVRYLYHTNNELLKKYSSEFLNKLRLDFNFLKPAIFQSEIARQKFIDLFKLENQDNTRVVRYIYEPNKVKQGFNHKRAGKKNILVNIIYRKENNLNDLFKLMETVDSSKYHFILYGYGPEVQYFLMKLNKANITNFYYEGVLRNREVAYENCDFVVSLCASEVNMYSIIDAYKCNKAVLKLENKFSKDLSSEIKLKTFVNIPEMANTINSDEKLEKFFEENADVFDQVKENYISKESYFEYE